MTCSRSGKADGLLLEFRRVVRYQSRHWTSFRGVESAHFECPACQGSPILAEATGELAVRRSLKVTANAIGGHRWRHRWGADEAFG